MLLSGTGFRVKVIGFAISIIGLGLCVGNISFAKDCPDTYFLSLKIKSASKCEGQHNITVGSGIVSPSVNSIFGENPAGLFYNQSLKLHVSAAKLSESTYDPWRFNATVVTGDGEKGAGIGAFNYQYDNTVSSSTNTILAYGAAIDISAINVGIGVSGFSSVDLLTSIVGGTDSNPFNPTVGMIFNPKGVIRIGATAYDVLDDYRTVGFGIASFVGSAFSAAADFTMSKGYNYDNSGNSYDLNVWIAKFGLAYASDSFQFSATYGSQITQGFPQTTIVESWNREGLSMGLALAFTDKIKFNAYYNRLELYYFGLTLGL